MKKEIRLENMLPEYTTIEIKRKEQDIWSKGISYPQTANKIF
jgi:hypothetical protein